LFLNEPKLFDCKTRDKKRPIDIAAEYGNLDVLKHLFDIDEFRQLDEKKGTAALINAAICHRESEVLSFLKRQHEHVFSHHLNTLHLACRQLHGHKMVSHLINKDSIMYQDKQTGNSPLMVAVQHHQIECVKELLSHKAYTQEAIQLVSPVTLRTVFHICAEVNEERITRELCQPRYLSSLLVLAADISGDTPLHICAKVGNVYMSKLLLDYINNISSSVETISHSTTYRSMTNLDATGHVYTILNKKNKNKHTPLHVAIYNENLNIIHEILNYSDPSVINACDDQKRTSLHMAAEKGEKVINYNIHVGITHVPS
jgi:ankyrin